jgi:hypothetical protein
MVCALESEGGCEDCLPKETVMKNLITSTLRSSLLACAFAVGVLASTSSAVAQNSYSKVKADIPFAFQVGSQHMPAGTYHIDVLAGSQVLLRGPGNKGGFVIMHAAESLQVPSTSKLVFDRYGNKYFLHQIWTEGNRQGRECVKSRAEKEILLSQSNQAPTLVEIALNAGPQR